MFEELPEYSIDELVDVLYSIFKNSDAAGPYYTLRVKFGIRIHFVEMHMSGRKAIRLNVNVANNTIRVKIYDLITRKFHKRINIIQCESFEHLIEAFKKELDNLVSYTIRAH